MMRPVQTREEYMTLRDSEWQKSVLKAVREGKESQKSKLIQMNYSCLPNEDGTLKGTTRMSTTVGMDIDHVPESQMSVLKDCILSKKDELGLLMLEESARKKGYHLVFKRRPELSQEENLRWAADLLGVDFDKAAKDITRVFFTTTGEELVFLDDEIFRPTPAPLPCREESGHPQGENQAEEVSTPLPTREGIGGGSFKGIPYSSIISEWWKRTGGEPQEGERNVKLYQLAVNLRAICDNNEEWLLEVMPRFELKEQEMRSIIHSACKEPTKGSRVMDQIIDHLTLTIDHSDEDWDDGAANNGQSSMVNVQCLPPEMPKRLPKVVQLLVSKTPDVYKPAVAHAIFPALGAHLWKVRFPYIDNVMHEAINVWGWLSYL